VAACARLGCSARYLGRFGGDQFGAQARAALERFGVDTSSAATVTGVPNRFAFVLVDQRTGGRTILWSRDPALSVEPGDVSRDAVISGRVLLVDSQDVPAAVAAARFARASAMPIILDVEEVAPAIDSLLRVADAIITAEAFPTALTGCTALGQALARIEQEFGAPLVCATLGEHGCLARAGGRELRVPAFAVDAVDTTGAGDVFRGAFAAACLRRPGGELEEALRFASAAAALNCRALGAQEGLPTLAEVEDVTFRTGGGLT
jgi:sugar/nucleoside kinase (ribokinase family)